MDDPSRHIRSREVEEEGKMIMKEFTNGGDDTFRLQSSFAKRHVAALANPNFNPFRSKSTPPLPQQTSVESATKSGVYYQPVHQRNNGELKCSPSDQDKSSLTILKNSSS